MMGDEKLDGVRLVSELLALGENFRWTGSCRKDLKGAHKVSSCSLEATQNIVPRPISGFRDGQQNN